MASGTVQVTYAYSAQAPDEHNLKVGDFITNVVSVDRGWCEGILNGRRGLFPANFVEPISSPGYVAEQQNKSDRNKTEPVAQESMSESDGKTKVRVTHQYKALQKDELDLELGAIITVLDTSGEEGWWEGTYNGKVGLFPSNFVEKWKDDGAASVSVGEKVRHLKGVENGYSSANVKQEISKQERKPGTHTEAHQEASDHAQNTPRQEKSNSAPGVVKHEYPLAKVLYPYTTENDDELTLAKGDVVIVLEQELEDRGWWKGELRGNVGVFPNNYVELLPQEKFEDNVVQKNVRPISQSSIESVPSSARKDESKQKSVLKTQNAKRPVNEKPQSEVKPRSYTGSAKTTCSEENVSDMPTPGAPSRSSALIKPSRPAAATVSADYRSTQAAVTPSHEENAGDGMDRNSATRPNLGEEHYKEMVREIGQLRAAIGHLKRVQDKRFADLMSEIDEEKKIRLGLEVEIERIKKHLNNK